MANDDRNNKSDYTLPDKISNIEISVWSEPSSKLDTSLSNAAQFVFYKTD